MGLGFRVQCLGFRFYGIGFKGLFLGLYLDGGKEMEATIMGLCRDVIGLLYGIGVCSRRQLPHCR